MILQFKNLNNFMDEAFYFNNHIELKKPKSGNYCDFFKNMRFLISS
jgi:hypothetical protein